MSELSRREREVVELVGRGRTYEQTAQRLGISRSAVTARLGGVYSKLGVGNVREVVLALKSVR